MLVNIGIKYKAIIEYDKNVGYYLYIFDLKKEVCLFDHLQDDLITSLLQAKEDYDLNENEWIIE